MKPPGVDASHRGVSGPREFDTKTACPSAARRRVSVPPMLPAPMMPICMCVPDCGDVNPSADTCPEQLGAKRCRRRALRQRAAEPAEGTSKLLRSSDASYHELQHRRSPSSRRPNHQRAAPIPLRTRCPPISTVTREFPYTPPAKLTGEGGYTDAARAALPDLVGSPQPLAACVISLLTGTLEDRYSGNGG
jgi:hypothetical protein